MKITIGRRSIRWEYVHQTTIGHAEVVGIGRKGVLGIATDTRVQIVDSETNRQLLDTEIHEALHIIRPEWDEADVYDTANDLAKLLWKLGYRKENSHA